MNQRLLLYSIRLRVVAHYLGYFFAVYALINLVPLLAALVFGEPQALAYLSLSCASALAGYICWKQPSVKQVQYNEACLIVCASFVLSSLGAAIPLNLAGLTPIDAVFEAISGTTTTGLSMLSDWQAIPKTTFFARAWLQWVGGLGIMIFSLAFLVNQGALAKQLSRMGPEPEPNIGGSRSLSKGITIIYLIVTVLGVLLMTLAGAPIFEALLHVMAAVSTGGFAPKASSLQELPAIQTWILLSLCLICSVSLPFLYKLWRDRGTLSLQGIQGVFLAALILLLGLYLGGTYDAWVLAISAQSTAGFSTLDVGALPEHQKLAMSICMLIGGGLGSTAGGFKVLRLVLFVMCLHTLLVRRNQTNHAQYQPILAGSPLTDARFQEALMMMSLYFVVCTGSWLAFVYAGYPAIDSLFEVSSALGTVGLSSGVTSSDLTSELKLILCLDMLVGRLEILPWLSLIYLPNWFSRRREI